MESTVLLCYQTFRKLVVFFWCLLSLSVILHQYSDWKYDGVRFVVRCKRSEPLRHRYPLFSNQWL